MPKVSVIIPAYNAVTYLPETVESVLRKNFTDFEVLIVNDSSSVQIVQWASQVADPRGRLISQENQVLSRERNTGIAHAQAEYIAFLDADDLWEPTKLENQVRCLKEVIHFRQQALVHYPHLRYSWEHVRLSLTIMLMHWLVVQGFDRMLPLFHTLHRRLSSLAQ